MAPLPSGSLAPAQERRLAVLLSHFHPPAPSLAGRPGAERHHLLAAAAAEAEAGISASPCAGGGKGESSGDGSCAFCDIVKGKLPAFKVRATTTTRPLCCFVISASALLLPALSFVV